MISEATGTFVIVLMSMMIMTKGQDFSKDKNIIAFTRAGILIAARLIAGQMLVTGLTNKEMNVSSEYLPGTDD